MKLQERKNAFINLGKLFKKNDNFKDDFVKIKSKNGWFIEKFVKISLDNWAKALSEENINKWLKPYEKQGFTKNKIKTIGIVMAGNIPLVGLHDLICILISNNKALIKTSSKDDFLIKKVIRLLIKIEPKFNNLIEFTDKYLKDFDAIIATGSNNTGRYFESYFNKYPNIIRKNRYSVAILNGKETPQEIEKLSDDIFMYFGLGCRNVSKIFIHKNFNLSFLLDNLKKYQFVKENNKYANNYDYQKSIFLLNQDNHLDNGFVLLKEDANFSSPISTLYYEFYENEKQLNEKLEIHKNNIQCIVGNCENIKTINLGETQTPNLWDYADNVDVLSFLMKLKS